MYRDLELSDRARIIQMAVRSGITDLDTIEEVYNRFADGGSKPPYNGEIKQGKKWTPLDHYLANNPKVAHGFRKAGVLVSDLARLIPGCYLTILRVMLLVLYLDPLQKKARILFRHPLQN